MMLGTGGIRHPRRENLATSFYTMKRRKEEFFFVETLLKLSSKPFSPGPTIAIRPRQLGHQNHLRC